MPNTKNEDENFLKALEEISETVEKMPDWKKEGWAILDEKSYFCGSTEEYQRNKRDSPTSQLDRKMNL